MKYRTLFVCIALFFGGSGCATLTEFIQFDRKGRGEARIMVNLSYVKLFSDLSAHKPQIQEVLANLEEVVDKTKGIKNVVVGVDTTQAFLSFSFESVDALNRALTSLYMGPGQAPYSFFRMDSRQIQRQFPDSMDSVFTQRWADWVEKGPTAEDRATFQFSHQIVPKAAVRLIYSPFAARVDGPGNVAKVAFPLSQISASKQKSFRVVTD